MRPMLIQMRDDPEIDLDLLVCGMHLSDKFGHTVDEVKQDFNPIEIDKGDDLGDYFTAQGPDIFLLYGDREESLFAATIALDCNIPIGHIQGGDRTGTQDDTRRHMLSKAANVHFVSTQEAADRLFLMNEGGARVFVVGDSHIDPIAARDYASWWNVKKFIGPLVHPHTPLIILQHPEPTASTSFHDQIYPTLTAVKDEPRDKIVIYPCSDRGCDEFIEEIEAYRGVGGFHIFRNLPSRIFLGLLNHALCIVGNSSCGIIEAPYLNVPAVNIGARQYGRLQCGNVLDVGYDTPAIREAIQQAENMTAINWKLRYGNGSTGKLLVSILKNLNKALLEPKYKS